MFACEISLILLCIFETIYAVLLLWVGHVVVHLFTTTTGIGELEGGKSGAGVDECAAVRIIEWPADVGGVKSIEGGV